MSSGKLLYFLLALLFSFFTITRAVNDTQEVAVSSGDSAFLPLLFNYSVFTQIQVQWGKDGTRLCQYRITANKITAFKCNPELKINREPPGLQLIEVKSSDAGLYKCSMTKLIPPPVEEKTATLHLTVLSLTLLLMNSSCVELLCSLHGLKSQQLNFAWSNATQFLNNKTSRMNSTLSLCKPDWTEGETLTCRAYYLNNHTLHKSIKLVFNAGNQEASWIIIVATSTGLFLLILFGVVIYKCKQRHDASEAVVYKNKIYENFIYSNSSMDLISNAPQNGQPANFRSRYNPHTITQTQSEECVYEN